MNRLSVLMSVYAKEQPEYLALALKSNLMEQTLPPDEMILVCDGPLTPGLDAVIEQYQKSCPALKVYRLPQNGGLGKALRFGMEKCTCEWVARSDSDDVCAPDRFEKQLKYLNEHPQTDILGTDIDEFDVDWRKPLRRKSLPADHESLCRLTKLRNPINHMSVMFRRKTILDCGSYIPQTLTEDYFLWVRAIANGAMLANLNECLVHARVGNGMTVRRGNPAYIGSWRKLNGYMLRRRMINPFEYVRNMLAIIAFVYTPVSLKQWIYRNLLRH